MKKLLITLFSFLALFVFTNTTGAFAEENNKSEILQKIEKTNIEIEEEIADAQKKGKKYLLELKEENAKLDEKITEAREKGESSEKLAELEQEVREKKEKHSKKYEEELDELIEDLIEETNEMTAKMIKKAAEEGIQAECSWVYVEIGNRWVWVDPIKVVGF